MLDAPGGTTLPATADFARREKTACVEILELSGFGSVQRRIRHHQTEKGNDDH
jgi:hypothetical protein